MFEKLDSGVDETLRLQEISTLLIQENNVNALYDRVLEAAIGLTSADFGSMQAFDPERDELRLLTHKGFHPESAKFWEWVRLDAACTCGMALHSGTRIVVPDVEACDVMQGTSDLESYRRSGIRSVQSTPLLSRSGRLLGMISTHWRQPHQPAERTLNGKRPILLNEAKPKLHCAKVRNGPGASLPLWNSAMMRSSASASTGSSPRGTAVQRESTAMQPRKSWANRYS